MRYLLLLIFVTQAFANSITALEYSWDTPAPPGSGVALSVTSGSQVNTIQNVPVTALPAGLHKLYVRAFDDSTGWGQPSGEWVYKHAASNFDGRNVAEFEIWFDNGSRTVYDVPDATTAQLIRNIPIASLTSGLHVLNVRTRNQHGEWGQPQSEWVYKHPNISTSNREIVEFQVWFDSNPGTIYDVVDASQVQLIRNLPIASLASGLHILYVRARDNFGNWGQPQSEWVYKHAASNYDGRNIAEFEVWFDNGSRTVYDVPDGTTAQLIRILPVASLSGGLHVLNVRARDQHGSWGQPQGEWVYKFTQPANDSLDIVQVELKVDAQAPTYINVTDSSFVALLTQLPANSMGLGAHNVCVRYQDERGIWSAQNCRSFFVIPGSMNPDAGNIAGAECWINVDPGEGNGIALLPSDGVWDEFTETAYVELTDSIPMGNHVLGVRVRDDAGQWSNVVLDTLSVGPLLVIQTSGNDVILSWTDTPEPHNYAVQRSTLPGSGFTSIATTPSATYTDAGIINTLSKAFYQVTFELPPGAQNNFRLPETRQTSVK